MNDLFGYDDPEPLAPRGSSHQDPVAMRALIDDLARRCVRNQPAEWWELCVEVGVALMTHLPMVPGSYLTAAVRLVADSRGIAAEPTKHNAWVSAIRMIFATFGTYAGRIDAVTPQTHDKSVGHWRSSVYDPAAPKPEWWASVMTSLPR